MRLYRKFALASVSMITMATPAYAAGASSADPQAAPEAPANAPNDDVAANIDPNQIIVQARRRDEKLQDVPVVINAIPAETLSKLNIRDFKDIITVVPGLSLTANANGIGSQSSLRGINYDVNSNGNNGSIQYYINDAPASGDFVFQTLFDTEQVTVERGPQGTLRGRAVPSGSIAITTHRPNLSEAGGYIDGTVGSASTANLNFAINVPIIADKLAVRVAGDYDYNRGSRVYSVNNPAPPFNLTRAIRGSVLFAPTDWFKAGFTYTGDQHDLAYYNQAISFNKVDPTVLPSASSPFGFAGAPDYGAISQGDRKSVESNQSNLQQRLQFYNWNAQATFAGQSLIYVGSRQIERVDTVGNQDNGGYFLNLPITQDSHLYATTTTHEIRLQNQERVAGIFDYVVGYFNEIGTSNTNLGTRGTVLGLGGPFVPGAPSIFVMLPAAAVGGSNPLTNTANIIVGAQRNVETSVFGNITAHLGEGTELSGGARHIKYRDPGQGLFVNGSLASPPVPVDISKTIYNFSIRHKFGQDLMVYASTGSSFRPGGNAIGDFTTSPSPNELAHTTTAPETSKNYEVGFKSSLLDRKVTLNATYYHQTFNNYVFRAADPGINYINCTPPGISATCGGIASPSVGHFNFISGVPVKVDGVEGEIAYRPSRHFFVDATLNYSKSRIGTAQIACNVVPGSPTLAQLQAALGTEHLGLCAGGGQSATFLPKFSGSLQSEFSAPIGDRAEGFIRGLFNYRGSGQNDPSNPYDDTKAYGLFNGYVGLRSHNGAWALTFYAKNLFDVKQIVTLNATPSAVSQVNVSVLTQRPVGSYSYVSRYGGLNITPPREFGVNLRFAFGSR